MMVGAGIVKAGVMPLHSWLPAAMVAPTPVSALLHAVAVVNAGAFAVIRVVCYTFGPELSASCGGSRVMTYRAAVTIVLSSLIAIRKTNLKARLAYSTVGQLSYMVLGVCILAPASLTGAVFHMAAHAFLKITLFMCAGAIMVTTHKADIRDMWGIGRRMPYTLAAFTLASLGIAGLPFLPAFTSKVNLITGAAEMGQPVFIAVLIASAMLSLTYLLPVGYLAFSKKTVNPDFAGYSMRIRDDANPRMLIPLLCTIVISFVLGIWPNFGPHMMDLVHMTVSSVF
jgi:multicomponent Na+:H+ antiporter subunit D